MSLRPRRIRSARLASKRTALLFFMTLAAGGALYRIVVPFFRGSAVVPQAIAATTSTDPRDGTVELVKVVDGDTLKVRRLGVQEYVRLLRIDTPEKGEPGYREATKTLAALVEGAPLRLEPESGTDLDRDSYGRILAYVFAGERNVNIAMVESGWAEFLTRFGKGKYAAQFEEAQTAAQRAGSGLWARGRPGSGDKTPH